MRSNDWKKKNGLATIPDILTKDETIQHWEQIVKNEDKNAIQDKIYKGEFKDPETGERRFAVREKLSIIYYHKCAYCEDIESKPEVEHYRPKKRVTKVPEHPGYYWLCYEWTNLLPSCRYCNTEGGKGNYFPVNGVRVSSPPTNLEGTWDKTANDAAKSPLLDEEPLLLHPEVDNPDDGSYFKFYNNGEIEGVDAVGRGEATIEICNLNRQNLKLRRQKLVIDPTFQGINNILALHYNNRLAGESALQPALELIFEELRGKCSKKSPFSLLAIYIFDHFDELIVPLFGDEIEKESISKAFARYKKGLQSDNPPF
jgi:hypothetical protein